MAFTVKDWKDAPETTTPLSAAAMEDLETRLATYTDGSLTRNNTFTGTADTSQAIMRVQGAPSTHLLIVNRTGAAPSNGNVLLVTGNDYSNVGPMDTTFGISGYETGKGTIKATHNRPTAGGSIDDSGASVLSLRCNGAGTAAQGIFFDAEQVGGTTGKLMNFRQNGVERFVVGPDGDIITGGNNFNELHLKRRSSNVMTMSDLHAQTALTLVSGTMYGVAAFAMKAGTYTNIRFCTGGTAPSALTDVRGAVWDSTGTVLQATANLSGTVTAASTVYDVALTSPVVLTEQQQVYLGVAWSGTTLQLRGASGVSGMSGTRGLRTFGLARAASGFTTGTPGTLTSGGTGIQPWAELG